ncbi:hypothetical protein DOY81_006407 [Sarcophaga bullata]|nr:hypothetical protein DOY81_006407 [Sarcophaga bullata]
MHKNVNENNLNDVTYKHYHTQPYYQQYLSNDIANVGLQMLNRLWIVGIKLFFNKTQKKMVQSCQIAASRQANDLNISSN